MIVQSLVAIAWCGIHLMVRDWYKRAAIMSACRCASADVSLWLSFFTKSGSACPVFFHAASRGMTDCYRLKDALIPVQDRIVLQIGGKE